jgi:predicted phosphodiesterase
MINPVKDEFSSTESKSTVQITADNIQRIGLMADSHGDLDAMNKSIQRLKSCNVDTLIHLGDFLDSDHSRDAVRIIDTFRHHHILAVKGNNDYQIENALKNNCLNHIPASHRKLIRSFLLNVPIRIIMRNICFAHSLPYDSIRSFYEPVDTGKVDRAEKIFQDTDYSVIFSGHSHFPVLFRNKSGKVFRETLQNRSSVMIHSNERFIIIVGSVGEGESGIMDMMHKRYERIRL